MATRPRNTTISGRQPQLDQQLLPVPDRREQGAGSRASSSPPSSERRRGTPLRSIVAPIRLPSFFFAPPFGFFFFSFSLYVIFVGLNLLGKDQVRCVQRSLPKSMPEDSSFLVVWWWSSVCYLFLMIHCLFYRAGPIFILATSFNFFFWSMYLLDVVVQQRVPRWIWTSGGGFQLPGRISLILRDFSTSILGSCNRVSETPPILGFIRVLIL